MNTTQDIVSNSDLRVEPAFKRIKTDSSPLKNITHSTSPLKTRETPYFQGINVGLATPEVKKSGDRVIPSSCESTKTAATVHVSYDLDQEIIKHQRSGLQRGMAMTNIPSLNRTPSPERSHSRLSILSNATSVTELGSQDQVE